MGGRLLKETRRTTVTRRVVVRPPRLHLAEGLSLKVPSSYPNPSCDPPKYL
ncbi:hypothetical protein COLO4_17338 [Corchorus olitorius]|uniref:Uncharacterized protein n=1 Tax=Corchorus olitorius TaxID=93759 RepID=A0A1R3JD34_9ROSI|nr:hypothetical protein COLO4_17338 [Corchorus olitorius]